MIGPISDDVDEAALADDWMRRMRYHRGASGRPAKCGGEGVFRYGGRGGEREEPGKF
jgi:hypothetical protein